jgi:hypothetical protein
MPELAPNSGLLGPPSPRNQRVKTKTKKNHINIYIYTCDFAKALISEEVKLVEPQ